MPDDYPALRRDRWGRLGLWKIRAWRGLLPGCAFKGRSGWAGFPVWGGEYALLTDIHAITVFGGRASAGWRWWPGRLGSRGPSRLCRSARLSRGKRWCRRSGRCRMPRGRRGTRRQPVRQGSGEAAIDAGARCEDGSVSGQRHEGGPAQDIHNGCAQDGHLRKLDPHETESDGENPG